MPFFIVGLKKTNWIPTKPQNGGEIKKGLSTNDDVRIRSVKGHTGIGWMKYLPKVEVLFACFRTTKMGGDLGIGIQLLLPTDPLRETEKD